MMEFVGEEMSMLMTLEVGGLNLERLLNLAIRNGILICNVQRLGPCRMRLKLPVWQRKRVFEFCARYGWETTTISPGQALRLGRWLKNKPMLLAGAALYLFLMVVSSEMIWQIRIDNAGKSIRQPVKSSTIGKLSSGSSTPNIPGERSSIDSI